MTSLLACHSILLKFGNIYRIPFGWSVSIMRACTNRLCRMYMAACVNAFFSLSLRIFRYQLTFTRFFYSSIYEVRCSVKSEQNSSWTKAKTKALATRRSVILIKIDAGSTYMCLPFFFPSYEFFGAPEISYLSLKMTLAYSFAFLSSFFLQIVKWEEKIWL